MDQKSPKLRGAEIADELWHAVENDDPDARLVALVHRLEDTLPSFRNAERRVKEGTNEQPFQFDTEGRRLIVRFWPLSHIDSEGGVTTPDAPPDVWELESSNLSGAKVVRWLHRDFFGPDRSRTAAAEQTPAGSAGGSEGGTVTRVRETVERPASQDPLARARAGIERLKRIQIG